MSRPGTPLPPPNAWQFVLKHVLSFVRVTLRPLENFLRIEAASGLLLLFAAAVALTLANSPWAAAYDQFWQTPLGFQVAGFSAERSVAWCVNDGLMVLFFFVVGMEIRREVHHGELAEWRRAALPAAAALGGMLAPACLYWVIAGAPATRSGWGVPMATDIAFAVGVLSLLGKRVPAALRVLLLALAVIDDLGAIAVIAVFYSAGIQVSGLVVAACGVGMILLLQRFGVRLKIVYLLPAVGVWAGVYAAGVHPTIAGVLVGLLTPVQSQLGEDISPAEGLIHALHPWVAFGIMPVFALANAGVSITSGALGAESLRVVVAVVVGLVLGKPVGVLLMCWLTLRFKIATLPVGLSLRHLLVLGVVAGVGFTMALFVAQLAFLDPSLLAAAKLGVLLASAVAGVLALVLGRGLLPAQVSIGAASSVEEAESSTEL